MRLLVVDDEELVAACIARLARALGADVVIAGTAEEAYVAMRLGGFDAVLCDDHLGRTRGHVVLEEAARRMPDALLVLTSGGSSALDPAGVADRFLAKPFTFDDVRFLVERAAEAALAGRARRSVPAEGCAAAAR